MDAGYSAESSADQDYGSNTFRTDLGGQYITVYKQPTASAGFALDPKSILTGLVVAGLAYLLTRAFGGKR